MIEFFRDVLDGPLYIIVAVLSLIFIMAILGFMMERIKMEKEEKGRIAYVNNKVDGEPVSTAQTAEVQTAQVTEVPNLQAPNLNPSLQSNINNEIPQQNDNNPSLLVKTPVVVFEDPDKK